MSREFVDDRLQPALEGMRVEFARIVDQLVPSGPVALLDFPDHPNVGDSAIYMGQCAWLATRPDCRLVYIADENSFDLAGLRRAMPVGTVLLHGGGNFGDLWPKCQAMRDLYLRSLTDYRIVQLPQSIWFKDKRAQDNAAQVARSHPDFTVLVRSHESYSLATGEMGLPNVQLVPDAAFLLGTLEGDMPVADVTLLARTDHERRGDLRSSGLIGEDWMEDSWPVSQWKARMVSQWCFGHGGWRGRQFSPRWANYLARQRLNRGIRQLSCGQIVVTDRLHACVLAILLGRRVVAMDNCYGKLRSVINTWLPDYPGIDWQPDPAALNDAVRRITARPEVTTARITPVQRSPNEERV